jgi:hypothetical protein
MAGLGLHKLGEQSFCFGLAYFLLTPDLDAQQQAV